MIVKSNYNLFCTHTLTHQVQFCFVIIFVYKLWEIFLSFDGSVVQKKCVKKGQIVALTIQNRGNLKITKVCWMLCSVNTQFKQRLAQCYSKAKKIIVSISILKQLTAQNEKTKTNIQQSTTCSTKKNAFYTCSNKN